MSLELKAGITLYFSRHGETQANVEKRFSGKKDTPLTPKGLEQTRAVGEALKCALGTRPALFCVASPLTRAQTTMRIARTVLDLPPDGFATDARIQEINLGEWDQLTETEARSRDPVLFDARLRDKWNVRVPGGENYAEVAARAAAWCAGLTQDTFAVSHGAFTRILRGLFLGLDPAAMSALDEPQGVVFRVRGRTVSQLAMEGAALSNPKPIG